MSDYRKQYKAYKRLYKELSGGAGEKQLLNQGLFSIKNDVDLPFPRISNDTLKKEITAYISTLNESQISSLNNKITAFKAKKTDTKLKKELETLIKSNYKGAKKSQNEIILDVKVNDQVATAQTAMNEIIKMIDDANKGKKSTDLQSKKDKVQSSLELLRDIV